MEQLVSLREANQNLSQYIKEVEKGTEFLITKRGEAVARLVPVERKKKLSTEQEAALARTLDRMEKGYPIGGNYPSREELHERKTD